MLGGATMTSASQLERLARAAAPAGPTGGGNQQRILLAARLALFAGARGLDQASCRLSTKRRLVDRPSSRLGLARRADRPRRHRAVIGGKENLRALDFASPHVCGLSSRAPSALHAMASCARFDTPALFIRTSSSKTTLMKLETRSDGEKRPSSPCFSAKQGHVSRASFGSHALHASIRDRAARPSRHAAPRSGSRRPPSTKWS